MLFHGVELVIDHTDGAAGRSIVVIERGELHEVPANRRLADPPIEIEDVGLVFRHDFRIAGQPIVQIGIADVGPVGQQRLLAFYPGVRGTLEGGELRVVDVRFELAAAVQEKVVLHAVRRSA